MSKALESFASKVVTNLQKLAVTDADGKQFAFDPSIIIVIAELLVPLIQAIQKCMADMNEVPTAAANVTLFQRTSIRLHLRRTLVENGGMSPREFAKSARHLVQSLIDVTKNSTGEEISALVEEVC